MDDELRYQLVLQFRIESLGSATLPTLVALEEELGDALSEDSVVDGHDIGSGEANIFVHTDDPAATFELIRAVLEKAKMLKAVTAAHRELDGEVFTVIWPKGSRAEFTVA